jgi:hypothetical protein
MKSWHWLLAIIFLTAVEPLQAYLDPGTGSMLLQVILGGIAALGVALKLFWHRIRIALGFSKKPAAEDESA